MTDPLKNTDSLTQRKLADDITKLSPGFIALTIFLFILSGLLEVGGGYLVWIGVRNKVRPILSITLGSVLLVAYGFIPTLQPVESFGRIYAGNISSITP